MSYHIPQEMVDLVIDHLHDEPTTLRTCCNVSKSWVQHTRKYLFIHVTFRPPDRHVSQWKRTFPDPTNSPAHNARTLSIRHPELITAADTGTLLTFCHIAHLDVDTDSSSDLAGVSLVPLHGFSTAIRSLRLAFTRLPNSEVFDLICSFPLLEDLSLFSGTTMRRDQTWNKPSISPRFTGSLELRLYDGTQPIIDPLLELPNGLHFTRITVPWLSEQDVGLMADLVSGCSDTLESLRIINCLSGASPSTCAS
jgi:hypothetical protein